jgi:predicted phosphoribosyltransferase
MNRFRDRAHAGHLLAERLRDYAGRSDVIILALPRGGVPVGFEVARRLHAPFDVFIVRKLGVPGHEEIAMGAIATGRVRLFNQEVIAMAGVSQRDVDAVTARELAELCRRERAYRGDRPPPDLHGRAVILVDDGLSETTDEEVRDLLERARAEPRLAEAP